MKKNNQNDYLAKTGEKLAHWRKKRKMTQAQLAEAFGVSVDTVSRYELGARQMPLTTMYEIAKILRISPNDLAPDELTTNAKTKLDTGINFQFCKLNEKDQELFKQLIERMLYRG